MNLSRFWWLLALLLGCHSPTSPEGATDYLVVCLQPDTIPVVLYGTDSTFMINRRCW
jgi:hypothetical protein